jgi:hypothetical protein
MGTRERDIMEQLFALSQKLYSLQQEIHELNAMAAEQPENQALLHRLLGESHDIIDQLSMLEAFLAARMLREQAAQEQLHPH